MIYYHGTVKAYLPSIQKEGLKPVAENAWRVKNVYPESRREGEGLRSHEKVDFVYLVEDPKWAKLFAEAKTDYLAIKPGVRVPQFYVVKDSGAPIIHTSPVVLELDLPQSFRVEEDPNSFYQKGLRYKGKIPPEYIKKIISA